MSKKANGEGSITKRADGRYMGRFTLDGKRKTIYGKTHEDVRMEMNKIMNDITTGEYVEPNSVTVGMWLREWSRMIYYPNYIRSANAHGILCPNARFLQITRDVALYAVRFYW